MVSTLPGLMREYPSESCIPVLMHPSRELSHDAYLPTAAKVVQQEDLKQIVTAIREFVAVLATKQSDRWTAVDVAGQLMFPQTPSH